MQAKELLRRLRAKDGLILLDPRSPFEFKRGHVPGALNAPVWKILFGTAPLPQNRSREIVVACMHGQRAYIAGKTLALLGYRDIDYLDGFLEDWLSAGLPWTSRPDEGRANETMHGPRSTMRQAPAAMSSTSKPVSKSTRASHGVSPTGKVARRAGPVATSVLRQKKTGHSSRGPMNSAAG